MADQMLSKADALMYVAKERVKESDDHQIEVQAVAA